MPSTATVTRTRTDRAVTTTDTWTEPSPLPAHRARDAHVTILRRAGWTTDPTAARYYQARGLARLLVHQETPTWTEDKVYEWRRR
jgi:hypothetical protein